MLLDDVEYQSKVPVEPDAFKLAVAPKLMVVPGAVGAAGDGLTVTEAEDVEFPNNPETYTVPVVPDPTVAVIWVAELITNDAAAVLPIVTDVTLLKLVPVITIAPVVAQTDVVFNEVITGGGGIKIVTS